MVTIRLARNSAATPLGIDFDNDNKVSAVSVDSVAHKAGLKVGDVITEVDGEHASRPMGVPHRRAIEESLVVMLTVRRGYAFDRQVTFTQRRSSVDL